MRDELLRLRADGLAIMSAGTDTYVIPPEWQSRADQWAADMAELAERAESEVAELRAERGAARALALAGRPDEAARVGEWREQEKLRKQIQALEAQQSGQAERTIAAAERLADERDALRAEITELRLTLAAEREGGDR